MFHKLVFVPLSRGLLLSLIGSQVQPFEAAYAKVRTKTVQLEERNVYCGAYYVTMVLDK